MGARWGVNSDISPPIVRELAGGDVRQRATRPLAAFEFAQSVFQIGNRKIRPAFREEHELSEGAFPQQKVGEALLAARSDEQIHFGGTPASHFRENVGKSFG